MVLDKRAMALAPKPTQFLRGYAFARLERPAALPDVQSPAQTYWRIAWGR